MIAKFFKFKFFPSAKQAQYVSSRYFSSEGEQKASEQNIENVVSTDKAVRDEQYEEMCFKFEREWKKIYDERNERQIQSLGEELTENQKKKVELVAQAILDLNIFEQRYMSSIIRDKIWKTTGINPLKINLDWPSIKRLEDGTWPAANPNWFMQQEAIAKLWPNGQEGFAQLFGGVVGGGGAPAGGAAGAPDQAEAAPKEEAPKEAAAKATYDIELAAIDAAQKIKIIKEVRAIFGLGLKEAKEAVETSPTTLKKGAKKDEAEKTKEKLGALGCTVNLL